MLDEGAVLDTFPDSPVPTTALADLERHEAILTAIPITAESHGGREVSERVLVQTEAAAIVAVYDDKGWTVDHRVTAASRDSGEVFQEAMIRAQGDSSLVEPPDNTEP
ncbi:hypothetical protein [Halonotius roseus]|uniref:DUF7964 domain-containing protein n=1 Tax=Halonotius roseus TaxID=2511997 RepID=A0A544QL03_9EURY|nr:hypothetical protein [Halonotius roseus]TQQ79052.1 hypothetical protein EWF95_13050 [Halonotius roseus]